MKLKFNPYTMTQNEAKQKAEALLSQEDCKIVFINENGAYWINNERDQMKQYFDLKGEKYFIFEKQEVEKPKTVVTKEYLVEAVNEPVKKPSTKKK